MNVLDIAIVVLLLLSGLLAFMRGFVQEVLGIMAWIGAAFAAMYGLRYAKPFAREVITIPLVADIVAGVTIFLVVVLVLSIITRSISRMVQTSGLNSLDRSLGFLFGLMRGALVACLGFLLVSSLMEEASYPGWLREAKLLPLVERGANMVRSVIPDEILPTKKTAQTVMDKTQQAIEAERAYRKLTQPTPAAPAPAAADSDPRYNSSERRGLDKLFQSSEHQ
ncbi:MAG: CvpA family protein [Alphaproteobacteria bacterium]|nr:CvpA family protein [Alphaproteobacteria bacterium]